MVYVFSLPEKYSVGLLLFQSNECIEEGLVNYL